jgi:ubiquitin-protein ligase E3 C
MSAFHTFTGSSRRPRNVNLSGQPSSFNPFAAPGSGGLGNPARTVNRAHAEREQRHRDRNRLQAAKKIQGVFRCYRARRAANDLRRERFDRTYAPASPIERIETCLPLLLRFHSLKSAGDVERLRQICDDIVVAGVPALDSLTTAQAQQLVRLLNDLVSHESVAPAQKLALLRLVSSIIRESKRAAGGGAACHYRSLVRLVLGRSKDEASKQATAEAALAPLLSLQHVKGSPTQSASL